MLYYTDPYNGSTIDDDAPVDTMPVTPPEEIDDIIDLEDERV